METENVKDKKVHQGLNVSKIRRYEDIKQEDLAENWVLLNSLFLNWNNNVK